MQLCKATPSDFEAIVRLLPTEEDLFLVYPRGKHPFTVEQLQALAEVRKELTVVVLNGQVVGFANLYDIQAGQCAFIGNVVISRSARGAGLGRALTEYMVQTAFQTYGVPEVRISVFSENTPALLLYASLEFEPYAVESRTEPKGKRVALIHMRIGREAWHAR